LPIKDVRRGVDGRVGINLATINHGVDLRLLRRRDPGSDHSPSGEAAKVCRFAADDPNLVVSAVRADPGEGSVEVLGGAFQDLEKTVLDSPEARRSARPAGCCDLTQRGARPV
jgi:hypothetical protein